MNGRLDTSARPSHHSRPSYAASITPSFVSARSAHSRRGGDAASLTDAELAQDPAAEARFHEHEEIAEIKRYEDFTTIDWIQDAEREQQRRRTRTQEAAGFFEREGGLGWRRRVWESYDAGQAWIVVALIGVAIGLNAAFLSIITEWLSDIKLGYCTTGFYLNKSFCCWGAEEGCDEWHAWSSLTLFNYVFYICFATLFAFTAARLVKAFAPYAAGSGISEIKCIIAGFQMKGFLGGWTLFLKSIGLPLAIASGLSVGKEGPSVHYAVCTGNVISRMFEKYNRSAAKTREILSACAATGVAVAFGSPIGGVLFSLEEMSNYFPLKTMWRSYFCAMIATAVLGAMNPFRTGQLVMFEVTYDKDWHFFEIIFYIILGVFGGLYGGFMIKWNLRAQAFRKKYLAKYAILEATLLATFTAIICFPNMFLRIDMTESMEILFKECENGRDYDGLCDRSNRSSLVFSLLLATLIRMFLVIVSYGCKVPAGIFVPSMAIGATFGRMVGILVQSLHETFPNSGFFASCAPDVPCITPGTYAFLGAGAALSGIMHITVSVVVIMFELTGALTYILPTMIVVGVTKAVSDRLSHGGIADRMIWFNGFPFLDNKEEHSFGVPVSQVMTTHLNTLPATDVTLHEIEAVMNSREVGGFPIVEGRNSKTLVGYIGRTELRYAIERAKRENPRITEVTICSFVPSTEDDHHDHGSLNNSTDINGNSKTPTTTTYASLDADNSLTSTATTSGTNITTPTSPIPVPTSTQPPPLNRSSSIYPDTVTNVLDFSRFINATPLAVHPRIPLETVMELFKKMGPRVILVEYHGKLTGLVTVKDCLKFQFSSHANEGESAGPMPSASVGAAGEAARREEDSDGIKMWEGRIWGWISWTGGRVQEAVEHYSGGRIVLGEPGEAPRVNVAARSQVNMEMVNR